MPLQRPPADADEGQVGGRVPRHKAGQPLGHMHLQKAFKYLSICQQEVQLVADRKQLGKPSTAPGCCNSSRCEQSIFSGDASEEPCATSSAAPRCPPSRHDLKRLRPLPPVSAARCRAAAPSPASACPVANTSSRRLQFQIDGGCAGRANPTGCRWSRRFAAPSASCRSPCSL